MAGMAGQLSETPKTLPGSINLLIGSAAIAEGAVEAYLRTEGIDQVTHVTRALSGEAASFGRTLPEWIRTTLALLPSDQLAGAWLSTGEFTVTLEGKGVGGRNQEMLLAFLAELLKSDTGRPPPRPPLTYQSGCLTGTGVSSLLPMTG